MSQQNSTSAYSEERSRERLQMIDTLKAPIIQMGRDLGYEVIENHDLGAGPVHITWVFKPGSESLPDMRLGFICLTEFSNSSINEGIARAMLNLVDKLVFVVPTETMTKDVKDPIGRSFERHKIAFTENSNRAEDYSTGFIIDYAHAQTNEQSF
jgi:hypothetical protein